MDIFKKISPTKKEEVSEEEDEDLDKSEEDDDSDQDQDQNDSEEDENEEGDDQNTPRSTGGFSIKNMFGNMLSPGKSDTKRRTSSKKSKKEKSPIDELQAV